MSAATVDLRSDEVDTLRKEVRELKRGPLLSRCVPMVYSYSGNVLRRMPEGVVCIVTEQDGYAYALDCEGDAVDWWYDPHGRYQYLLANPRGFYRHGPKIERKEPS